MRIFSTFSGIGGFEIGIQNAYSKVAGLADAPQVEVLADDSTNHQSQYGGQPPTCVGYSEIDKYAIKVYEKQFKQQRDTTEREEELTELRTNISNKNYDIISIWKHWKNRFYSGILI